jgi:hypothetical protein
MSTQKKPYRRPVITRVKFEDKGLVSFAVCRKQTQLEQDSASCCVVMPESEPNKLPHDLS